MKNRIYATPAVKGLSLKHTNAIARESLVWGIFQTHFDHMQNIPARRRMRAR